MSYFLPKKYVKQAPNYAINSEVNYEFAFRSRIMPYALPILAVTIFVTQVFLPLISFTTQDTISKPASQSALGVATGFREFEFQELNEGGNVLGKTTFENVEQVVPNHFYITIPKLGIKDAVIETNSTNLQPDKALGHYNGSSLPGEVGNTFIYGHSVLPYFFNPKNYKTIFSTLHNLEAGDLIYVTYNNKKLTYKVEGKRDLKPEKVNPLATIKPKFLNESTMILMTCSPAGTKLRRLLVDTVLISTE